MPDTLLQQEMTQLVRISWIVLIPVGVLLSLVLYKLMSLLHGLSEFLTIARYELSPAIKDLRVTAENVEILSTKAVSSVQKVEQGIAATRPAVQRGLSNLKSASKEAVLGLESLWSGLRQSFDKQK